MKALYHPVLPMLPFSSLPAPAFLLMALLSALVFALPAWAAPQWAIPDQVSQGRAFLVSATDSSPFTAHVTWQDKKLPLAVRQEGDQWKGSMLLALPIDAKGLYTLTASSALLKEGTKQTDVTASKHTDIKATIKALAVPWHEERITVEPRYVTPPPEVQKQIEQDRRHTAKVLSVIRPEKEWALPFQRPVKGTISGSFGGRRVFNNQPRSPHTGTDMRGAMGTPVLAAADGVVVLVEHQYYSGNVIYLDHGQGVFTMYAHLSAFGVNVGDKVSRGQSIGKVGATGRVTGPHLHFTLKVLGEAVDAMPLCSSPLKVVGGPTPLQPRPAPKATTSAPAKSKTPAAQSPKATQK